MKFENMQNNTIFLMKIYLYSIYTETGSRNDQQIQDSSYLSVENEI
jgi:hypothetical protein